MRENGCGAPATAADDAGQGKMGSQRKVVTCYTCQGEGHMARDCPRTRCHYCGRTGHIAKVCAMGRAGSRGLESLFVFCDQLDDDAAVPFAAPGATSDSLSDAAPDNEAAAPAARGCSHGEGSSCGPMPDPTFGRCFARRFIVPLHALPDFDPASLVHGRFDVACRCVTSALMRSQSVRHNAEICLCFAPSVPKQTPAQGGAAGEGEPEEARVAIAVRGGLVRELKVDEHAVASRLRFALDSQLPATSPAAPSGGVGAPGAAAGGAAAAMQGMEESVQKRKQRLALEEKLNRGVHCWQVMVLVCAGPVVGLAMASRKPSSADPQQTHTIPRFSPWTVLPPALCRMRYASQSPPQRLLTHKRQQTAARRERWKEHRRMSRKTTFASAAERVDPCAGPRRGVCAVRLDFQLRRERKHRGSAVP